MTLKIGEKIFPGIEEEVALEQAKGTISNIIDAIVELVTNCDDSYTVLEKEGKDTSGNIDIYIERRKGGKLDILKITDQADGMDPDTIEKILIYGKRTSGLFKGVKVRGFFGRGLKESIVALGTGEIISSKNGLRTTGEYYWDEETEKLAWKTINLENFDGENGTTIIIRPCFDNIVDCPKFETLEDKLKNHFALRDILAFGKRKVILTLKEVGLKKEQLPKRKRLKYTPQSGQQIEDKRLHLKGFGIAVFKLFESTEPLDFSKNDPGSQAGVLIKTSSAALDLQLFGFDRDPHAHHFFGEVYVPGISEKIKSMERGLIRPDRTGLNWNHKYCQELENEVSKFLSHHIERRRKQHDSSFKRSDIPEHTAIKISRLVKKLNKLSREILGEEGEGLGNVPSVEDITKLTIYPTVTSGPPDTERNFTVYNNIEVSKNHGNVRITLDEPNGRFKITPVQLKLHEHKKQKNLILGYFKIKGFKEGDKTGIIARQGRDEDIAEFMVGPKRNGDTRKKPPKRRKGGLFNDFVFDVVEQNPIQRVYYNRHSGEIRIYVYYPGVFPFLKANGEGSETERGSMLLSELIAEAFCKETARQKVEQESFNPAGNLDHYLKLYNEHLKKCIPIIHSIWIQ